MNRSRRFKKQSPDPFQAVFRDMMTIVNEQERMLNRIRSSVLSFMVNLIEHGIIRPTEDECRALVNMLFEIPD